MKITIKTIIAITLLLVISSCSENTTSIKAYPLDVCLVTDNALGTMGDPVSYVHGDQEIKFCCNPCIRKFKKNPEKYISILNLKAEQLSTTGEK